MFNQRQLESAWAGLTAAIGVPSCPMCQGTGWSFRDITGTPGGVARWYCQRCGYLLAFDVLVLASHMPAPDSGSLPLSA